MISFLHSGPAAAPIRLVLAHGAGAPMTSPFMEEISALLGGRGLAVSRFEFGYMAARRSGGPRRPPPKVDLLVLEFLSAVALAAAMVPPGGRLVAGGKSMGGRIASMAAGPLFEARQIGGLVCLGYPFHPPGKPDSLRTAHLEDMRCPALVVQGERDPFGNRDDVLALRLPATLQLHWAHDGDHDLGPRGRSGTARTQNLAAAADAVDAFVRGLPG